MNLNLLLSQINFIRLKTNLILFIIITMIISGVGLVFLNLQKENIQTTFAATCGDDVCEIEFENSTNCEEDCGNACYVTNMISWWKGENNATDSYGNNNGVEVGTVLYSSGKVG